MQALMIGLTPNSLSHSDLHSIKEEEREQGKEQGAKLVTEA